MNVPRDAVVSIEGGVVAGLSCAKKVGLACVVCAKFELWMTLVPNRVGVNGLCDNQILNINLNTAPRKLPHQPSFTHEDEYTDRYRLYDKSL